MVAQRTLIGSGGKLYLITRGWKGDWFRGDVMCLLTRTPKGWQWTAVGISEAHDLWVERWRPATKPTNQPLPFSLLAPWPAGQSFQAGGLAGFVVQQAAIVAAGLIGGRLIAAILARNPCGFGPRGFYYNQGSTHDEEDAFAIDFTRYRRNIPYDPESGGTPVLAVRDGIVASVSAGRESGDSSASNIVEIVHEDPGNPTDTERFRSRYLHLAGPFMIPVSAMMPVITGQRLGLMDDTGNSWLNHLHFSIHDRNIPHPNESYGSSVRPSPLDGVRLGDGDSGTCVRSSNIERFPGLNFRPAIVSFGSVQVGQTETRTLTAENSAGVSVIISLAASPSGSVFQWEAFNGVVADGTEISFDVAFRPTRNAIERASLMMTSTAAGSPHSIGLIGKGPGGFPDPRPEPEPDMLEFMPVLINFGSVPIGSVGVRSLTIRNPTGLVVNISFPGSSPSSVFQWEGFDGVLANEAEISVDITFRPTSNAIERMTLIVASTAAGSPHSVGLIGKGPGGFPVS
ncbi:MAG: choice-of-anchor D domain-containing protein [Nitrosospira sp.]